MVSFTTLSASALALASTALAAPTTNEARSSPPVLYSYNFANYDVNAVKQTCSYTANIKKETSGAATTALLSFYFDNTWAGKTCRFGFNVPAGQATGNSDALQLFTTLGSSQACNTAGGVVSSSSGRNNQVADIKNIKTTGGTVYAPGTTNVATFPCPSNTYAGFELVGTGDSMAVWFGYNQGLFISTA